MSVRLAWLEGGTGRLVRLSQDAVEVLSSVPWPPGSRVEGRVEEPGRGAKLRMKVHACRRGPDGDFLIAGRPLDMTTAVREKLSAAL